MNLQELRRKVQESHNIVFFGGAGTSTESGIPDFRSADGLFHFVNGVSISPEKILSRTFFLDQPDVFYEFYTKHMLYPSAVPNPAHHALADLEERGVLQAVITQNIDGLHQLAGSQNVLELHGSVHRNRCMDCHAPYALDVILRHQGRVPRCERCDGIIKPDVVLYEESLDMALLHRAAAYIEQADVLIIAGTSLSVQPAAGLIRYYRGDQCILINRGATPMDDWVNYKIQDSVAQVLPALINGVSGD